MSIEHRIVGPACAAKRWLATCLLLAMCGGAVHAAAAPSDDEAARELFERGDYVAALPFYERLVAVDLVNSVYAERVAFCLAAKMEPLPAGAQREQLLARALGEADRARRLGNGSITLQSLLGWLTSKGVHSPDSEEARFRAGEQAVDRGDLDAALVAYKAVAAQDPKSYLAHLYTGDVYFRMGDMVGAADWFGRAILIEPDSEEAYRYWADSIAVAGDDRGALPLYIRAVVAEPYKRESWASLHYWAERNGMQVLPPQLPRPDVWLRERADGDESQVSIDMDPGLQSDLIGRTAWLAYGLNRGTWMKGRFLENNPAARTYRHSLQEEAESMRVAFEVIRKDVPDLAQAPVAVRDLGRLVQDGFVEAYVLLVLADESIVQDYATYRRQHRAELARFIEKYMLQRVEPAQ